MLTDDESSAGRIRPVRHTYTHVGEGGCGKVSRLRDGTAKLMADNPLVYHGLRCQHCGDHLPIGQFGVFVWEGTTDLVGT